MNELLDRRVLGAIRCQDGLTGLALQRPLNIASDQLVLRHNRHGDYVIFDVIDNAELHTHITEFEAAPAIPAIASVAIDVQISDPLGDYLPQRYRLRLPRDPDPQSTDAIFKPIVISLYRSPSADIESNWAVIRATLTDQNTGQRLPWALVRVRRNGTTMQAMADWRGEALIALPGIPITTWNADGGAVLTKEVEVRIDVVFDPQLQPLNLLDVSVDPNRNYLPNPERLSSNDPSLRRGSRTGYKVASGRDRPDVIAVSLS